TLTTIATFARHGRLLLDLELQSRLAGGVSQGLDPAMILVASTVETNLVNTGLLGPLGHLLAHDGGRRLVAAARLLGLHLRVERAGRRKGRSVGVVDHLGVDVLGAAEDGQTGPLGRPGDLLPHVPLAAKPPHLDEFTLIHRTILCVLWGFGATD